MCLRLMHSPCDTRPQTVSVWGETESSAGGTENKWRMTKRPRKFQQAAVIAECVSLSVCVCVCACLWAWCRGPAGTQWGNPDSGVWKNSFEWQKQQCPPEHVYLPAEKLYRARCRNKVRNEKKKTHFCKNTFAYMHAWPIFSSSLLTVSKGKQHVNKQRPTSSKATWFTTATCFLVLHSPNPGSGVGELWQCVWPRPKVTHSPHSIATLSIRLGWWWRTGREERQWLTSTGQT